MDGILSSGMRRTANIARAGKAALVSNDCFFDGIVDE